MNSSKYPILGEIARDILAIQVSNVASKYAFSMGGRVLDSFQSSLNPPMEEALICCQNWLRSTRSPLDLKPQLEDHESYASLESSNYKLIYFVSFNIVINLLLIYYNFLHVVDKSYMTSEIISIN